jgi:LuxR family transcriptional regulator, maltose regulon positive regulatory protein
MATVPASISRHDAPAPARAPRLRTPEGPPGCVWRPRLTERLRSSALRLVLVSAPAGFGKSVAIGDWLRRARVPHAWLSLDAGDNDPQRFFTHLAEAVRSLDGPAAERAAAIISRLASGGAPAADELGDALRDLDGDRVLVIDDLHLLEAGAVISPLQALLEAMLESLRVVLITRVDPPLALGRLRAAGAVCELREHDLRFTRAETAALLDALLPGTALEDEVVATLEQRTEGWVAGLRMAALAMERAAEPRAVVEGFTGSHRFVVEYLLEEAMAGQPPEIQRFLMETAVLDRFTAAACVAVTGRNGAGPLLEQVERANLFLIPLGDDRVWYRYHHLFAELLQFRLRRLQPERADELNAAASRWFEAQGDVHQAMEHAARHSDPKLMAELLDRHALLLLRRSELATLARFTRAIADPYAHPYPIFLIALGWLRILTERSPELEPIVQAAAAAIERPPAWYSDADRERTRLELEVLRAFAARFAGRLREASEIGAAAIERLGSGTGALRGRLLYNQARIAGMFGETDSALELLERSLQDNLADGNFYLVLTGLAHRGALLAQTLGCARAAEALSLGLAFAAERGLHTLPAAASLHYHLGYVHLIADDRDAAEAFLRRAVELGSASGFPEGRANGLVGLARLAAARGRSEEARSPLEEATVLAHDRNTLLHDTTIELEHVRLALLRGEPQDLVLPPSTWEPAPGTAEWTTLDETDALLRLGLALRSGDPERAAALAERLSIESRARGRGVALCVARLAAAMLADGDSRWPLLDEALAFAAARGYVRPLVEIGEPLRALLTAAATRPLSPAARAHALLLLDRFPEDTRPETPALSTPLTDREQEALGLLLRGLSNKAIARAMYVSAETVKTHLKHIYAKLGVEDRREAVARARNLGIAPEA